MPCSSRVISEVLPEFLTLEKRDFLKPIIHSQVIQFSVDKKSLKSDDISLLIISVLNCHSSVKSKFSISVLYFHN